LGNEKLIRCPGCGVSLPSMGMPADPRFNASGECWVLYMELSAYTLGLGDPSFPHQYVVDAFAAQHAGPGVKPINTLFALVGLYLAVEKGFTGRQVQRVHMLLAARRREWPRLAPPAAPGAVSVRDVLQAEGAGDRMAAIKNWDESVWDSWAAERQRVMDIVKEVSWVETRGT
jgi:hypothetical protein